MQRSPHLIVKEFADSASEQVRKNAITAFAVLQDDDSLREVLRLALSDAKPEVRETAEKEIVALPPERLRSIIGWLEQDLAVPEREHAAYALLGSLRNRGLKLAAPRLPVGKRIHLAKSLRDSLYPGLGLRFRLRALWPSILGAAVCSVMVVFFTTGLFSLNVESGDLFACLFLALLFSVGTALFSTQYSSPIGLNADPLAAAVLDLGATVGATAVVAGTVAVIGVSIGQKALGGLCFLTMALVLAAAVRVVTLLVFGIFTHRLWNRIAQVFAGAAAGILAISFLPAGFGLMESGFAATGWLTLIPASAALANSWSAIDAQARVRPLVGRGLRAVGFLPFLVLLGMIVTLSIPAPPAPSTTPQLDTLVDQGKLWDARPVDLWSLPASIPISLQAAQPVRIQLFNASRPVYVFVSQGDPGRQVSRFTLYFDGHFNDLPLSEAGMYYLRVEQGPFRLPTSRILASLAATLKSAGWGGRPFREPAAALRICTVQITFNAKVAPTRKAR